MGLTLCSALWVGILISNPSLYKIVITQLLAKHSSVKDCWVTNVIVTPFGAKEVLHRRNVRLGFNHSDGRNENRIAMN